jgi:hypothetical protein
MTIRVTPSSADVRGFAFRISRLLGLTTGLGVMAWGAWSLALTVAMAAWDDYGATLAAIPAGNRFNQGVLQSAILIALGAVLIALGAVILELRRIGNALDGGGRR